MRRMLLSLDLECSPALPSQDQKIRETLFVVWVGFQYHRVRHDLVDLPDQPCLKLSLKNADHLQVRAKKKSKGSHAAKRSAIPRIRRQGNPLLFLHKRRKRRQTFTLFSIRGRVYFASTSKPMINKETRVEVPLFSDRLPDRQVDSCPAVQMVVVEISERCVQPVNATCRLCHALVGVVQTVEDHRVRLRAVPSFSACRVLNQIDPSITLGYRLMPKPIPLLADDTLAFSHVSEHLQFIVEVVEYHRPVMTAQQFADRVDPPFVTVYRPPQYVTQTACIRDRLVLVRVPSGTNDKLYQFLVKRNYHPLVVGFGLLGIRHVDHDLTPCLH